MKSCYGPVLDLIAGSGVVLDTLVPYSREEWQSNANWKTMLENYLECYHCAVAHPGFNAAIDVRPDVYTLKAHGYFSSQSGQVRPAALEGKSKVELYDVAGDGDAVAVSLPVAERDDQHQSGLSQPVDRCLDAGRPERDQGLLRAVLRTRRQRRLREVARSPSTSRSPRKTTR